MRGAACVFGRATGTRELETLDPTHHAGRVDAIMLTGGSAYGLDATAGRYEAARAWVTRTLEAAPDDPLGLYFLARLDRATGRDEEADHAWSTLVSVDPAFADSVTRASGAP